ncbi:hypothetical protein Desti_5056 [Desulfomonile tiedjei DSM 6799]|uniref:Uncharacterized protein n=1 Tax=Desulfomonile tiedjei (strain ATCC 49306 / DSM 6799 / DCB-1) TaxID=706587 RepID=I4CDM5_DESTA|nr:hypothetical protein Desti_5056 [Desulfomonile tiedjei DSM 6799]
MMIEEVRFWVFSIESDSQNLSLAYEYVFIPTRQCVSWHALNGGWRNAKEHRVI